MVGSVELSLLTLRYLQGLEFTLRKESIQYALSTNLLFAVIPAEQQVRASKVLNMLDADHKSLLESISIPTSSMKKPDKEGAPSTLGTKDQQKQRFLEVASSATDGSKSFSEVLTKISNLVTQVNDAHKLNKAK